VPGYDFVDNDNNPSEVGALRQNPSFGHGTHVAGIVALTAPDAKIMPLRVLNSDGEGELWRVTQAVIWAAQNGAKIVNISFGYPDNPNAQRLLKDLIDDCEDGLTADGKHFPEIGGNRLAVIAGAGNGATSIKLYPAGEDLDGMLGVGASTRNDTRASFSNFNGQSGSDWVEVSAPGENIVSALPGGRYGMWSGTSMAAPIVSGIAALVKAKNPALTPNQFVDQVKETAVDVRYGNPQIRIRRVDALCAVLNNQFCVAPATPQNNIGFEAFDLK